MQSFGTKLPEMTGPYRARNPLLVASLYGVDQVLNFLPKRQKPSTVERPLRVLVANWGHLGDVVTILPLLKFLECHPRVQELGVMVGSWCRPVLTASNIAARLHVIDHWALDRSDKSKASKISQYLRRRAALVDELSRSAYDMSIDTFASFPSSHLITWRASIPRRVGFTSGGLGPCLTDPFDWIPDNRSMLGHQLELLKPLIGEGAPTSLPASYPGFQRAVLERDLEVVERPYIVIHMGSQNVRGWTPESWRSLAGILRRKGYQLVATGAAGEEAEAAESLREIVPIKNLAGRLTWAQFLTTVADATAVVTINSVAGHVAACFGVPTVVIAAGRQRLSLWRPNNSDATMVMHGVACAPCNRTNGCAAMACIRLISVADVVSSLEHLLAIAPPEA